MLSQCLSAGGRSHANNPKKGLFNSSLFLGRGNSQQRITQLLPIRHQLLDLIFDSKFKSLQSHPYPFDQLDNASAEA